MTAEIDVEIIAAAKNASLDPATLLAVVEVEANGQFFARIKGHDEPLIRFEGHYFDRRLSGNARKMARGAGLSHPVSGTIANPRTQAERWHLLDRACEISADAAYESTSWGIGQVMGAHWKALGYPSVMALVNDARSGAAGQIRLLVRFIQHNNLAPLLIQKDWSAFARRYNGPGFRKNNYDGKLRASFARHSARLADAAQRQSKVEVFKIGMKGEAVAELQTSLASMGFTVDPTGIFDVSTRNAVVRFQSQNRLLPDGIVGEKTAKALAEAMTTPRSNSRTVRFLSFSRQLFGLRD
jgi:N-acetylmuramidase/Putative peptidoglycan binding domain